jgi:hypothetical protein
VEQGFGSADYSEKCAQVKKNPVRMEEMPVRS